MSRIPNENSEDMDIDVDELMNPQKCGWQFPLANPNFHFIGSQFVSPTEYHVSPADVSIAKSMQAKQAVFSCFFVRPDVFKAFALGGILDLQMFVGLQDPYLDRSLTY